jgi:hypothetical protein
MTLEEKVAMDVLNIRDRNGSTKEIVQRIEEAMKDQRDAIFRAVNALPELSKISTAKSHWLDSVEIAYLRELLANRNITALSREELKKEMGL